MNNKTYYPHIHFMISQKNNEHWELTVRTVNIVCNINHSKLNKAIKDKSYLIINALPKEYFDKEHIPNSVNLYYEDAQNMTTRQIDTFIRNHLDHLNNDINKLVKNKELALRDIPIIVYCYNAKCDAGKKLANKLLKTGYHKILEYEEGVMGYLSKN